MSIESNRQDREDRVMGALDLATKPIQAAKSMGQFFLIAAIVLGLLIGVPVYLFVTGQPVSQAQWEMMGLALMFLFTLVYAPFYTIIMPFVAYAAIGIFTPTFNSLWDQFGGKGLIFLFLLIGITQKFMRQMFRWLGEPPRPPRRRLAPLERMALIKVYGSFNATPEYCPKDTPEFGYLVTPAKPEIAPPPSPAKEQTAFEREHRDTIENMQEFVSSCRQPLEDALRGTSVLSGDTLVNANEAILMDIWQIWSRLQRADGNYCLDAPRHLLKALCCLVEPKLITASDWEFLMCELYPTLAGQNSASSLRLPGVVSLLVKYDVHAGAQLASKAAATFRNILLSLAALLNNSIAVKMVVDEYLTVLKPHIKGGGAGSAEFLSTSAATGSSDGLSKDCATLGVKNGATPEEVKQAYRDLAKVWHPDRFDSGDTRLQRKAEEQLKAINDAYARIKEAQPYNPPQSASKVETMPHKEALLATTVFITTIGVKILDLRMMMYKGSASREDIGAGIEECFAMNREAVMRLETLIRRFKQELPEYPRTEIESMHSKVVEWEEKLTELATSHGFVRSC